MPSSTSVSTGCVEVPAMWFVTSRGVGHGAHSTGTKTIDAMPAWAQRIERSEHE